MRKGMLFGRTGEWHKRRWDRPINRSFYPLGAFSESRFKAASDPVSFAVGEALKVR